jgi:hypothetical protein
MAQTVGSQIFGNWYDVIGWASASGLFFYIAFAAHTFPVQQRNMMPTFLLNKSFCISIGVLMGLASIGKALFWW